MLCILGLLRPAILPTTASLLSNTFTGTNSDTDTVYFARGEEGGGTGGMVRGCNPNARFLGMEANMRVLALLPANVHGWTAMHAINTYIYIRV